MLTRARIAADREPGSILAPLISIAARIAANPSGSDVMPVLRTRNGFTIRTCPNASGRSVNGLSERSHTRSRLRFAMRSGISAIRLPAMLKWRSSLSWPISGGSVLIRF